MPRSPDQVELVVFDLGRVLIRLAADRPDAASMAEVDLPSLSDSTWKRWETIRDQHETGGIGFDQFAAKMSEISGLDREQHARLYEAWLRGPFPGIEDLIDTLRSRSIRLACLSNTNDFHWDLMTAPTGTNALPMDKLHHRFASHLIGVAKPDAAIYEHVERETGAAPGAILFFDDSSPNVEAARARGWRAELIADNGDSVTQMRRHLRAYGVL